MKSAYKTALFLLGLLLASGAVWADDSQEFTKTIKREFDISRDGATSISNQYGKVDVKTWDRNRVKIEVNIVVKAGSESAAQEVFDRIEIAFSNTASSVKASTRIETLKGIWSWVNNTRSDYSINYEVFLPATNQLELQHKYGDAYVGEMTGKVNANLKYANLKMESAGSGSSVNLSYGNGAITKAKNLSSQVSYGKLSILEAENLEISSSYSKMTIERAGDVSCNSRYDDYTLGAVRNFSNSGKYDNITIGSAENVSVVSHYTQVRARKVTNKINLDLKYGGAETGLGKGFSEASLVGNYTDFKIAVENGANYQMDAATTYAGIAYPAGLNVTYELEKGSSHQVKGHQGNQNGSPVIKARLSYGSLKVREQ